MRRPALIVLVVVCFAVALAVAMVAAASAAMSASSSATSSATNSATSRATNSTAGRGVQDPKPAEPPAAEFKIPEEEIKRSNPVRSTAASVAAGKRIWGTDCAFCHGATGDGKGDLVEPIELKLLDYREPKALEKFTDGELHYIIVTGKGKMPAGGGRLKGERAWHLVNYVRSLARKEAK